MTEKMTAAEAAKRVPKGTTVTVPVVDPETGERATKKDPQGGGLVYPTQTVPLAPEHILAVKDGYVVTVDGRRVALANA